MRLLSKAKILILEIFRIVVNTSCNEGMHHDTKQDTPSLCILYFGPNLDAFFSHFLAAAHQGNAAGIFRSYSAGAGFGHLQFKAASLTKIHITFFHITTIRHGEPPLVLIRGRLILALRSAFHFV